MSGSGEHPVEILWRMQQEEIAAGSKLPHKGPGDQKWAGLAFGVGDLSLVVELTGIIDVLECPAVTPVPGTHSWLRGICNIRGRLFSVVDMGLFLGVTARGAARTGRILVVNDNELDCALLVPKVFGLRYFTEDQASPDSSGIDDAVLPYVDRTYVQENRVWTVLSLECITGDDRFLNVGRAE